MVTSGLETKVIYKNISDSWIDVSLWHIGNFQRDWRVYGQSPDPWDAPQWIQDSYSEWPPEDEINPWTIQVCEHLTSTPCGEVDYENATSDEDIQRTSADIPLETCEFAVQGPWSGLIYEQGYEKNEPVCDVVNLEIHKIRIERVEIGFDESVWRFWVGYGNGKPSFSGTIVDLFDYWNAWDTAEHTIKFDVEDDGTITILEEGTGVTWPTTGLEDPTVYYDTELDIQKSGVILLPASPYEIFSPLGVIEFQTILDAQIKVFTDQGWDEDNISFSYIMPLVRKLRIIET